MPALRDGAGLPPPGMAQDDPSADGDRARHQPRLPVPAAGLRLRPHGVPLGPGGGAAGEGVGLRPGRGGAHRPPAVHRAPHAGRDLAGTGHALAPRHLRAPRAEPAGGVPGAAAGQPARRARANCRHGRRTRRDRRRPGRAAARAGQRAAVGGAGGPRRDHPRRGQPAAGDGRAAGGPAPAGAGGGGAGAGGGQRRAGVDPPGGGRGVPGGAPPAVPVARPAGGGRAPLGGRPPSLSGGQAGAAPAAGGGGAHPRPRPGGGRPRHLRGAGYGAGAAADGAGAGRPALRLRRPPGPRPPGGGGPDAGPLPGKRGDSRLARLRVLVGRALERCGPGRATCAGSTTGCSTWPTPWGRTTPRWASRPAAGPPSARRWS